MNKRFGVLFFFAFAQFSVLAQHRKPAAPQGLKASIIVPCYHGHARYLASIIELYEQQTILPYEMVISLSEAQKVDASLIQSLRRAKYVFPVTLITSDQKLHAGENRNNACSRARGDIFICQDADDIPHPQRVEIIKYFFETFNVDYLLHQFMHDTDSFEIITAKQQVPCVFLTRMDDVWHQGRLTFGNPALHRRVFQGLHWGDLRMGEDVTFAAGVFALFNRNLVVKFPLYVYRSELSSLHAKMRNARRVVYSDTERCFSLVIEQV